MSTTQAKPGLLNSWKEIAAYLGRGVRTVQRWEKIGLPVCRVGVGTRSPVLAYTQEIDFWIQTAQGRGLSHPQAGGNLPVTNSLRDAIQQARLLRIQNAILRKGQHETLQQLIATLLAMKESCATKPGLVAFRPEFGSQGVHDMQAVPFLPDNLHKQPRSVA